MSEPEEVAAWGIPTQHETLWPPLVALLVAVILYVILPRELVMGPWWLVPALELALLIPLVIAAPGRRPGEIPAMHVVAIVLIAIVNTANIASLALLLVGLLHHAAALTGQGLLISSISIWLTNIIVFGLWYWELDRGGPAERAASHHRQPDFLFPQMITPACSPGWRPRFLDYLYLAYTNATAFSPADVMPLTLWAKALMTIEGLASLLTIALVAARAVNILS